jgi:hypothetical protein
MTSLRAYDNSFSGLFKIRNGHRAHPMSVSEPVHSKLYQSNALSLAPPISKLASITLHGSTFEYQASQEHVYFLPFGSKTSRNRDSCAWTRRLFREPKSMFRIFDVRGGATPKILMNNPCSSKTAFPCIHVLYRTRRLWAQCVFMKRHRAHPLWAR